MAALTRVKSCKTRLPAPMLRWPTSELPICPSGSPTAGPEVASWVCGHSRAMASRLRLARQRDGVGVRARIDAVAIHHDQH